MVARTFLPHPVLRSCVEAYMHLHPDKTGQMETFDLFPAGRSFLVFLLNQEAILRDVDSRTVYTDPFFFVGQLTAHRRIQLTDSTEVCVIFKPTGLFRLLGIDQSCIADDSFAVKEVFSRANDILARLQDNCHDAGKVIRLLDHWLLQLWEQNNGLITRRIDKAVRKIISTSGTIAINDLCNEVGMSHNSLTNHFKTMTGIPPKMYARVTRFNHVYRQIEQSSSPNWQELIFRYKFYDQAHFIHEFNAFYGSPPGQPLSSVGDLSAITTIKAAERGVYRLF